MTALVAQYVNSVGTFLIGILLINPDGSFGPQGAGTVTLTANDPVSIRAGIANAAITYAAGQGYTITAADVISEIQSVRSTTFGVSRSLVTGTGAVGFQVSSSQDSMVNYGITMATTATIGGSASGTVVLEVAPTNSATAGDWKEVARFTNGQSISLAIALQSVQTLAGNLTGIVPAGYYAKLRTINNSGSPTFTYASGQETLL